MDIECWLEPYILLFPPGFAGAHHHHCPNGACRILAVLLWVGAETYFTIHPSLFDLAFNCHFFEWLCSVEELVFQTFVGGRHTNERRFY